MENIIYFLKQKKHGRVKVGSTKNIVTRLKKLEKEWGEFDENSEFVYFNNESLKSNSLSLDNIEKTMQRILKSKNLYYEIEDKKDGYTEFFHLDELEIKSTIELLGHLVEKNVFLMAFRIKTTNITYGKIKDKEYLLKVQKANQVYMLEKENRRKKNNHSLDSFFEDEQNLNLKMLIIKSKTIEKLQKIRAIDLSEYSNFSFCFDYGKGNVTFIFNHKDKKKPMLNFCENLFHLTSFTHGSAAVFCSSLGDSTTEEIYSCNRDINDKGKIYSHEKYYIFKLVQMLKNKLPLIPFSSKFTRLKIFEKYENKLYHKEIWDGKLFKVKYIKNLKETEKYIYIYNIVEYCVESEFFEILLTSGEVIKLYYKVSFIEDGYGTYKHKGEVGSPCLTKKEVSTFMRNKSFISSGDSSFLFYIMDINNIFWYYKSDGKELVS